MGVGPNVGMKMKEGVEDSQESLWQPPINQRERITWAICLPLKVASHYTMPNCRLDKWKNWFLASFFISMLWISIFSYIMVWMITIIGKLIVTVVYLPFSILILSTVRFGRRSLHFHNERVIKRNSTKK